MTHSTQMATKKMSPWAGTPTILKTPYSNPPQAPKSSKHYIKQMSTLSVGSTTDTVASTTSSVSPWSATPAILKDPQIAAARARLNKRTKGPKSLSGLDTKMKKNVFSAPLDLLLPRNTVLPSRA